MIASDAFECFKISIDNYHIHNDVDRYIKSFWKTGSIDNLLYDKNWIDCVQWHLEDMIREDGINPTEALHIKRRIDQSNQQRTDIVEIIDDYFVEKYKDIRYSFDAPLNSESLGWLLDRMSILALKLYHMEEQLERENITPIHMLKCNDKLSLLLNQKQDISLAFDTLIKEIESGKRTFKVYRQVKMYNDSSYK